MRQTKTKSERSAKRCPNCGCKTWGWDSMREMWLGPYHFQDCPTLPGNDELITRNLEDKIRWEQEDFVPRDKGWLILKAIRKMLDKRNTPEEHEQYKRAILAELRKVEAV